MPRPSDLRSWIARIESSVSCSTSPAPTGTWRSARSRRSTTAASRPAALLFDDIVGYPRGYRVLTGSLSNARRMAVTLGLDPRPRHARAWCRRFAASRCSGKPRRRASSRRSSSGPDSRERRPGRRRRPHALPGAALARARRRTLHRHRRRGGDERSRHGTDQRRRLPDDDPGGRPLGHHQRRGRQAGARAVRSLVREARQGAGARLVRPRSAAADGRRHRGPEHDQRVRATRARWSGRS